jgi:glycine/D-amino acid oxidase-like deaminating enzyme
MPYVADEVVGFSRDAGSVDPSCFDRAGRRLLVRVLICGGGVIGAAIAYFLSRRGAEAIVIERTEVACAASGKSGGFLALDWCDGTALEALARRSFALHARLPEQIGGDWGYRRLDTFGGVIGSVDGGSLRQSGVRWVSDKVTIGQRLGSPESTAQVHPARFTRALLQAAESHGAELRIGPVSGVLRDHSGNSVVGVQVGGDELFGDAVVIAMGPWSILATAWLPLPAVFGLKGHSILFDTGTQMPAEALFLEQRDVVGAASSPEVFPRSDNNTYVCGLSSQSPLPVDPTEVAPDPGAIERLHQICRDLSPVLARSAILARQACFRPITTDGLPLIGRVKGVNGAYVATGHSVWGILNAPATGEAMAELIIDGEVTTVDLFAFDP